MGNPVNDLFEGRSRHSLDEKGRLAIPARFREILKRKADSSLVVTNLNNCLVVFARDDWQKIKEKAVNLPLFDSAANIYIRYFISGAIECPLKQGRILIPSNLRELAELNKEVVLVGHLTRFEIWDKTKWEKEFEKDKKAFQGISQSLSDMGI
jgi:MraZ protein